MAKPKIQTFSQLSKSLADVIAASYKLAPCLVIVLTAVVVGVTAIAVISSTAMVAVVLLLVFAATVVVYASTSQFGEATLALVAGILTAYGVDWTPNRFVGFVAVWTGFCFVALMIASIKVAASSESIYRQAAIAFSESEAERPEIEKGLRAIGDDRNIEGIGPIERAEVLRLFAYRKIPIEVMPSALRACAMLTVITQIDHKKIGAFIADVFTVFDFIERDLQGKIIDVVYQTMQRSAVPPADFISGFEHARHLVLSRTISPLDFILALKSSLESGIPPCECAKSIAGTLKRNDSK